MKRLKKLVSVLLILIMCLSMGMTASATPAQQTEEEDAYQKQLEVKSALG